MRAYVLVYKRFGRGGYGGASLSASKTTTAVKRAEALCLNLGAHPFLLFMVKEDSTLTVMEWKRKK